MKKLEIPFGVSLTLRYAARHLERMPRDRWESSGVRLFPGLREQATRGNECVILDNGETAHGVRNLRLFFVGFHGRKPSLFWFF